MNKPGKFFLILLVSIAPYTRADTLPQSVFYGNWKYTGTEGTLVCTFTQDTWTVKANDDEPMTVRILNWEQVDNGNIKTFQMFPNGFKITIRDLNGGIVSTIIHIDKEKKHIIMSEFSEEAVLTKQ
jgi:hypothetical protein